MAITSAVFAQMTAECPYTLLWAPIPQNCPFPLGDLDPYLTRFLGPIQVLNPNGISIGSAIFAGLTSVTDHTTRSVTSIYVRSTGDVV